MDDELWRHLDAMMVQINDGFERLSVRIGTLGREFHNTREFLINDALIASRRLLDADARIAKLEQGKDAP